MRSLIALGFLGLPVAAQSINVDFGPTGSPVPSPVYGASNGRPGVWNAVSSLSVSNLRAWDGTITGVSLSNPDDQPACNRSTIFFTDDDPATSGDDAALLDDRYGGSFFEDQWTFEGLAPGDYDVDTIVLRFAPCMSFFLSVSVDGSTDPTQYVGGHWPGYYTQGDSSFPTGSSNYDTNFARHAVTVTDGTLRVRVAVLSKADYLFISGIQLDMHEPEPIGTSVCPGDGAAAPCPCGNSGQTGIGCQNSAGTGGSWLFATGTTNPDTVVLHASGELPHALSVFLQGNSIVNPIHYGDGLRCTGGTLKRLYTKSAVSGVVFAPGAGDPSITVQSANLGVPIVPGGRRYYQVFYRDANPGFCPSPTGSTFNVSNGVRIDW